MEKKEKEKQKKVEMEERGEEYKKEEKMST